MSLAEVKLGLLRAFACNADAGFRLQRSSSIRAVCHLILADPWAAVY